MICPHCQATVAPHHAFCMQCGSRIAAGASTAAPPAATASTASLTFPDGSAQTLPVELDEISAALLERAEGANRARPSPSPAPPPTESGPALQVQQMRPPRAGSLVTLAGRVRWPAPGQMPPTLSVECPVLHRSEAVHFRGGDWAPFSFDLQPQQSGTYRIQFRVEAAGGDEFSGEYLLDVAPAVDAAQVIQIHNQQTNDARIAVGQEAHINVHVAGREDRSPSEPAAWLPVSLHRVGSAPVARVASGLKQPWRPYVPGREVVSRLSLRIRKGNTTRNICLLGGSCLRIGKQRGQNDVVLRIIPPHPDFDRLWGRVSRRHAEVHFTPAGAEWRNGECGNGTLVDGRLLAARQSVPIRQNQVFRPAGVQELDLQCTLIAASPADADPEAYHRFARKLGAAEGPPSVGPYAGLRLTRVNNWGGNEEYLLLQRGCGIGSDAGNGLVIPDASVSLNHALLLYNACGFWLEPIQQQQPTRIDGQPVGPHKLVQLLPGMPPLQLGDVEVGVTEFQQWYIDVAPTEYR